MAAPITPPPGHLCIGGPYAGRIVATRGNHPRFVAAQRPDGLGDGPITEPFRPIVYTIQSWSTVRGQRLEFWTPDGQDAHTTMRLLMAAYETTPIKELSR